MLKNMKIGSMLFMLLGFLSALVVGVGSLGLWGERETDDSLEIIYNSRLLPIEMLTEINDLMQKNVNELLLARLHDPVLPESAIHEADHPISKHLDIVRTNKEAFSNVWEEYLVTAMPSEEKKLAENASARRAEFMAVLDPAMALLREGKFAEASLYNADKVSPLFQEMHLSFDKLKQFQIAASKKEKNRADANFITIRNITFSSIVIGLALALSVGWWMIRSVTGRISDSMSAISTSATEIAATINQHERTASQQASAATETSATITELSASSRQSAEQAANASNAAEQASATTAKGGDTTREAVAAMNELKNRIGEIADQILRLGEQTGQIGSIATLVKDLSGQINMLALNAAVEAARAGEHGKGFAVVAAEVRKLADQSRKSAEQATALVGDIQKATHSSIMMTEEGTRTVAETTQLTQKVADLFTDLAGMASSVNENAHQVMLNAKQQSAAFAQIVSATDSIAAGAKETAAGISQTKVGVRHLNEAAENLRKIA